MSSSVQKERDEQEVQEWRNHGTAGSRGSSIQVWTWILEKHFRMGETRCASKKEVTNVSVPQKDISKAQRI